MGTGFASLAMGAMLQRDGIGAESGWAPPNGLTHFAPKEQVECTRFLAEFKGSAEARRQLALVLLNHNDFVTIR